MNEVHAELAANVWKVLVSPGDAVEADQPLLILESMKMEIPVVAPAPGTVAEIACAEGDSVAEDDILVVLR